MPSDENESYDELKKLQKNNKERKEKRSEEPLLEENINLESVLTYQEEVPRGVERRLADNLDHAFAPCRLFMLALFRFPLLLNITREFDREFSYSWKSTRGWMFFITGAIMFLNALLIMLTLAGILLNFPVQPSGYKTIWKNYDEGSADGIDKAYDKTSEKLRIEEIFLMQRNFVPVIIILLSLCHICTSDVSLFFQRNFVAKYFTFWDEAVEIMKIDAGKQPESVRKFMLRIVFFYFTIMVLFLGLCFSQLAPVGSGGPGQLVILWGRTFFPQIHAYRYFYVIRYFGDVAFAYIVMCSKVYILLFLYKCKILKNAFAVWNERLENVLHKNDKIRTRREQCETRTGFDHLFRDYVVLLDLLRGSDTMFANIIESYYGTQVFSVIFEVYYFVRCLSAHEEFQNARKLDGLVIGLYLFNTFIMLFLTSTSAAEVGEVAMDGLEIIRRKGFLGRKTDEEMFFTLSLYMSYTGHFETALAGGRYVIFDRGFLVAILGAIFSYFIILIQFKPNLAMLDKKKLLRIDPKALLRHVENTNPYFDSFPVGFMTWLNDTNSSILDYKMN